MPWVDPHDSLVGHQTPSLLSTLVPINSEQSLAWCLGALQQLEITLVHDSDNSRAPPRAFLVSHIFVSSQEQMIQQHRFRKFLAIVSPTQTYPEGAIKANDFVLCCLANEIFCKLKVPALIVQSALILTISASTKQLTQLFTRIFIKLYEGLEHAQQDEVCSVSNVAVM